MTVVGDDDPEDPPETRTLDPESDTDIEPGQGGRATGTASVGESGGR